MAVGLLRHIYIPSQLQGSVLYGDCTDFQECSEASEVWEAGCRMSNGHHFTNITILPQMSKFTEYFNFT